MPGGWMSTDPERSTMMRRQLCTAAALAVLTGLSPAQSPDQAEKLFESLYGKRLAAVRRTSTSDDDIALTKEMLEAVTVVKAEPAMVGLLCGRACDVAVAAGDYAQAVTAIETLQKHCPNLKPFCDKKILEIYEGQYLCSSRLGKRNAAMKLIPRYLARSGREAHANDYIAAIASARKALRIAVTQRLGVRGEIQDRILMLSKRRSLLDQVKSMKASLKNDPENTVVRTRLIRRLMFDLDDPVEAAKYVAGADEMLQTYVPLAAQPIDKLLPAACMELAEWYHRVAAGMGRTPKAICLRRAAMYVQQFLTESEQSGIQSAKAELLKKKIRDHLAKLGPVAGAGGVVLPSLDLKHKIGPIWKLDLKAKVARVCFPPEGPLAVAAIDGGMVVCDLEKAKLTRAIKVAHTVVRMAISPNGQQVIAALDAGRDKSFVQVWNLLDGRQVTHQTPKSGQLIGVGFWEDSPVAARLTRLDQKKYAALLWCPLDDKKLAMVPTRTPWVIAASWSSDFRRTVIITNGSADAYMTKTGEHVHELRFGRKWLDPFRAIVTPDGKTVAMGQRDVAPIFDLTAGKLITTVASSGSPNDRGPKLRGLSLSANGRRLAAGTEHGAICVWDARTGRRLTKSAAYRSVADVSLSPDGKFLLTGGDTSLGLWGTP